MNNGSILTNTLIKLFSIDFSVFFTQDYFTNCLVEPFGNDGTMQSLSDVEPPLGAGAVDGQNSVDSDLMEYQVDKTT